MKYTIRLVLIALFSWGSFCHAQKVNLKAGVSMSKMKVATNGTLISEDYLYHYGGYHSLDFRVLNFDFASVWSGVSYSSKGYRRVTDTHFNGTQDVYNKVKLNLRYLEVPIFGRLEKKFDNVTTYGVLGGYVGLCVFGKYNYKEFSPSDVLLKDNDQEVDIGDAYYEFRLINFGLMGGVGVEYNNFIVEYAYDHGTSDVDNIEANGTSYRNRAFRLTVGMALGQ